MREKQLFSSVQQLGVIEVFIGTIRNVDIKRNFARAVASCWVLQTHLADFIKKVEEAFRDLLLSPDELNTPLVRVGHRVTEYLDTRLRFLLTHRVWRMGVKMMIVITKIYCLVETFLTQAD